LIFWANRSYPSDAIVALVGRTEDPGTSSTHYYLDFSHGIYDSPGITVDSWVNGERSNTVSSETSDYYWDFNTVHTFRYAVFGSTHKFWWAKDITQPPDVTGHDELHTAPGRIGLVSAQARGWWDNLKTRKYVESEPSTSLGSEESQEWYYRLDIDGIFIIDVSVFPLTSIQTAEIQLRYRANDNLEKWHIKACNWTAATYTDSYFNNTSGHTPTTGWDKYTVNLTDKWRSYISRSVTMHLKIQDNQTDSNQTIIDIEFLALRVVIDGTRFTFDNRGALTSRLVSLWVNKSTHHQRFDIDVFVNSGDSTSYICNDIDSPKEKCTVKIVTERGNIALFKNKQSE
jgi:hypothetical protein